MELKLQRLFEVHVLSYAQEQGDSRLNWQKVDITRAFMWVMHMHRTGGVFWGKGHISFKKNERFSG